MTASLSHSASTRTADLRPLQEMHEAFMVFDRDKSGLAGIGASGSPRKMAAGSIRVLTKVLSQPFKAPCERRSPA